MLWRRCACRALGRKHGLDGRTEQDKAQVDMAVEAVESLRLKCEC